jgi:hypothetical protein
MCNFITKKVPIELCSYFAFSAQSHGGWVSSLEIGVRV